MAAMSVYDHPRYYEVAFRYQDVKRQVDFFEAVARKFCDATPRRFLDIACGPSPQLREIARRGYEAVGLDRSRTMLGYLRHEAAREGLEIDTVCADMRDFRLEQKCDFAFVLSGSLYVSSNDEFLKHLSAVSNALNDGGIYLLENMTLGLNQHHREEWTAREDGVEVQTAYESIATDAIKQLSQERLILEVTDHGKRMRLRSTIESKDFAPEELKSLVELSEYFRFLGYFKHLALSPLREIERDNVVLMQKSDEFLR